MAKAWKGNRYRSFATDQGIAERKRLVGNWKKTRWSGVIA